MKYYVTADIHGFYMEFQDALKASGYYEDKEPHKLIILGDLFDRGSEAKRLQAFVLNNMENLILIRGNHEDLFEELVTADEGLPYSHHVTNGTYQTALQLTGFDPTMARIRNYDFVDAAKATPFTKRSSLPCSTAMKRITMFLYTDGSHVFTAEKAIVITVNGEMPAQVNGIQPAGITVWTQFVPAWRRKRLYADTGIHHMATPNMKESVLNSGGMPILAHIMLLGLLLLTHAQLEAAK